uniref:Uncharacterized protein n=1 Tax=Rhizochromulina marina TaxID=1034831 RepID=A0A7S2WS01_9STRA
MSEYEELRRRNIERNKEVMRALGLDQTDFALHRAADRKSSASSSGPKRKSKKRPAADPDHAPGPRRRSSRLQGQSPTSVVDGHAEEVLSGGEERGRSTMEAPLHASEEDHALAEAEHLRWAGKQKKASVVGTASYQHTLHRVRTMDEAALARRIKAIERAAGQHAVVKMRLFARVLCLEGHDELASDATASLQRLIELLGDPGEGQDD